MNSTLAAQHPKRDAANFQAQVVEDTDGHSPAKQKITGDVRTPSPIFSGRTICLHLNVKPSQLGKMHWNNAVIAAGRGTLFHAIAAGRPTLDNRTTLVHVYLLTGMFGCLGLY